ncbi:hypothetical protein BKA69DRAFT_1122387 [Paraphysoderma sedebokerense]|nr:hypothetical protein BKA69DRAFT_1122387 [Paraphysoderma sedebokerense]
MKLKIELPKQQPQLPNTSGQGNLSAAERANVNITTAVSWNSAGELYAVGDTQEILRYSQNFEQLSPLPAAFFAPPTDPQNAGQAREAPGKAAGSRNSILMTSLVCFPLFGKTGAAISTGTGRVNVNTTDMFVVGSCDGKIFFIQRSGRVEKVLDGHKGAVTALKWNRDGSALASAGEDGQLKIWSRSGMLRSVLIQTSSPIYSIAWSPESDSVLITNGKNLMIKPLQPSSKSTVWKAHDGLVLTIDWNYINGFIISGGEDKKYKVWDPYGRQIFASNSEDHVITAVSWSPTGDMFGVGGFNVVRICDKLGWSYAISNINSGSILDIAWTVDGTQFACAGGNGTVHLAHVVGRQLDWKHLEAVMVDERTVQVKDVTIGHIETIDFTDKIVKASLSFGYLVIATVTQCHIFSERHLHTPAIIDLKNTGRIISIIQSRDYFVMIDTYQGVQVFSYDGKFISSPKYNGLRIESLSERTVTLSTDTLAIRDTIDEKTVHLFDVVSGKTIHETPIKHTLEIIELGLDQVGPTMNRMLVLIDKNRNLYVTPVNRPELKKLGTMVDSFKFHEDTPMLSVIMDGKFVIWYCPYVMFIDQDLIHGAKFEKDASKSIGKNSQICWFKGCQVTIRRADGAVVVVGDVSPFPATLYDLIYRKKWEEAIKLCRFAKDQPLWACLAGLAISGNDLNTAEVAYAALEEAHKVQHICYIKDQPTNELRNAELLIFKRQFKEAENIMLGGGYTYKAIKLWMSLFQWERALEISIKHKVYTDVVLYFRSKYLISTGLKETNQKIMSLKENVVVDEETVLKIVEREESKAGPGSK